MSLLTVDTKSELQTYENEACLYNIKLSLRKIGTYVVLAIWGSVFLGIIICLGIYGWKAVIGFLTAVADKARMRAHVWDDMLFFSLLVLIGVCVFPGMSVVELTCGFVLGFQEAFILNYTGTVVSAMVSFWLGRYYLKDSIINYFETANKYLNVIERKNGLGLLILFRLMFIPFFVKNYGPSVIQSTSWFNYTIAVLVTSPAYSALFAFMGSEAKSIADVAAGGGSHAKSEFNWLQAIPVVLSVVAGTVFTWVAYIEFQSLSSDDEEVNSKEIEEEEALRVPLTARAG